MAQEPHVTKCPQCGQSFPTTIRLCPNDGTVLEHPTQTTQVGTVLDGKYRLDAFLSRGGMGAVFRATHVMLGKTVAVKLINPELVTSPEIVRRFQREARAATALNHPNIVAVYDLGQTPSGTLYIAMEFVDGPSLKASIDQSGAMAPARIVAILRQVASALSAAHRHGIIHRDLKPHNIMLARTEGAETAKLVDFGIAKTFDEATQLTMTGFALGTPQYMAPEQAEGKDVDARSDLYSLGVILYAMLSGQVPFNDGSTPAILIKHIQATPERPSLKNPAAAIPKELEAIAMRCLEKNPAARFQTADEFAAALEEAARAIPGSAAETLATVAFAVRSAVPPAASTISSAPTVAAPTVSAADTRPTAVAQPAPAPPPRDSSRLVLAALIVIGVAGGAAILYTQYGGALRSTPPAATSSEPSTPSPAASPATALPTDPPRADGAASTTSEAVAADPAPGAASTPAGSVVAPSSNAGAPGSAGPGTSSRSSARAASPSRESRPAVPGSTADSGARVNGPPAVAQERRPPVPALFPENPAVFFHCAGPSDICAALRTAVDDAMEKAGLSSVRNAARADIDIAARVEVTQERADEQFRTAFAVRTYSIDLDAEATRTSENVAMPSATTVSFDPQFGAERANEKARVVASDIVDRVKAFARKKRG